MNLFQYVAELARQVWPFMLQVGGGGVTGYETNKWALRMLFREYWGFGGYIVKTRRQFTDSISELVETDIINARTLAPYLHGRELEEQVKVLVRELLGNQLGRKTEASLLGDIPGSVRSLENLAAFVETRGSDFAGSFLERILPGVPLEGLISAAQQRQVLMTLVDLGINVLGEGDLLAELFSGLCDENRELRVGDLVPPALMEQLVANLRVCTSGLHVRLRERHEVQLDELWRALSRQLETDQLVGEIEGALLSRTPAGLLGYGDGREALAELVRRLLDFVNSEYGQTAIGGLVEAVVTTARASTTPLAELVGDQVRAGIVSFLERELPGVIEQLIAWVEANRAELEELIEEAVAETLEEQASGSSGAMAGLRQWLYKSLAGGNVARQFGIVGRIITALEEGQDDEAIHSLAEDATDQLISYLGSQSLGGLVQAAERNGIIDIQELGEAAVSGLRTIARNILEAGMEPDSRSDSGTETDSALEPDSRPESSSGTEPHFEPDPDHGPQPDSAPETDAAPVPDSGMELDSGTQPDSEPGPDHGPQPDSAPEPNDGSEPRVRAESEARSEPGTAGEGTGHPSLATIVAQWVENMLDAPLVDVAPGVLSLLFGSYAHDPTWLGWKWFKESYLFTPLSTKALQAAGAGWLENLNHRKLGELLDAQALIALCLELLEQPGIRGFLVAEGAGAISGLMKPSGDGNEDLSLAGVLSPEVRTTLRAVVGTVAGRELATLLREMTGEYRELSLAALYARLEAAEPARRGLSRLLVELLEQHLGSLLSGRVAHIVAENLDELPDERLREMVEDFMGEHLGPITWLGALVGGAIGTILYYLQTLGWNATGYLQAALVYGFAGWITNVMALWAIFKPYEEKRVLGVPLPLTPGIVAKNKARFAVSMGEFIDEKLLNAESLHKAFRENRKAAEAALQAYLENRGPSVITEVLRANGNLGTIAGSAAALAQNQVLQRKPELARWVAGLIRGVELKQFDLAPVAEKAEESILKGLDRLPGPVSVELTRALGTSQPVSELLPGATKSALYHGLEGTVHAGFGQIEKVLADPERLRQLITGLLAPLFAKWQHATVAGVADLEEGELSERLAGFVVRQLQSPGRRHTVTEWLRARLTQVAGDRTLGDLAGGSLLRLARNNADLLADTVVDRGLELLGAQREAIKNLIGSALQQANPLLALFNLRHLTDDVVDRVVDEKLPVYLEQRRDDTRAFVGGLISAVGRRQLGDLGLETAVATALEGTAQLLERIATDPGAVEAITCLVEPVANVVEQLQLSPAFEFVRISQPEDVVTRFHGELELARLHVLRHLEPETEVETMVAGTARLILGDLLDEFTVAGVTRGMGPDMLAPPFEALIRRLESSAAFRSALGRFLGRLRQRVEASRVGDFVAEEVLVDDLRGLLDRVVRTETFSSSLQAEFEELGLALDEALPELVDPQTWDYFTSVVVQALLEAMSMHLPGLVGAVDLAEVTEQQLRQMSPAKIEQLFNSFASRYFARLRLYGWFGAGFGIVVEALRQLLMGM